MNIARTFRGIVAGGLLPIIVSAATAKYSGGSGMAQDPYQIATAADLIALGETPEDYDKHFILTADIDLDPNLPGRKVFDGAIIAPNWETPFTGVFDGNAHTIAHLTIEGGSDLGLFGQLESGDVENLGVVEVNITGSGNCVGGLIGDTAGTVTGCWGTGAVTGGQRVGGLTGYNAGLVTASYAASIVRGDAYVGGLVGESESGIMADSNSASVVIGAGENVGGLVGGNGGEISRCHNTGAVAGAASVGGLVGRNDGTVNGCQNTGGVTGDSETGGLVGHNLGTLTQCSSTGAVDGGWSIGGLVGLNNRGEVIQCYSLSAASGTGDVGGLIGWNTRGTAVQCYSAGVVRGRLSAGGLVDTNEEGVVNQCFWDTQTSGQTRSNGGTGKTTIQMEVSSTFLVAGWDFAGELANGAKDIWWIVEGKDYPRLRWQYGRAFVPDPVDGASEVLQTIVPGWKAGGPGLTHEVYMGEDKDLVAHATREATDIYRGRQLSGVTTYDPGILQGGRTYYWRVDEVKDGDPNSPWHGTVWRFTTAEFPVVRVVDDFESYTNSALHRIYQTWIDGFGDKPAITGNGTGSMVGYDMPPFAEQTIVHSGGQSLMMVCNNVKQPCYSEAERTWATPQDWTTGRADTLTLYFRGKADNSREPLYVGIEDNAGRMAVVVHPDAEALLATEWEKWHIALADVRAAGVDVAAVKKMVIGVGNRQNPNPGGIGRIYVDDIRLTKQMP